MININFIFLSGFLILFCAASGLAEEPGSKDSVFQEQWFKCESESDCVVEVNSCFEGVGYNKFFEDKAVDYIKHNPSACRSKFIPHYRSTEIAMKKREEAKNAQVSCVNQRCTVK